MLEDLNMRVSYPVYIHKLHVFTNYATATAKVIVQWRPFIARFIIANIL